MGKEEKNTISSACLKKEDMKRINSLKNQQALKFLLPGNYIFHLKILKRVLYKVLKTSEEHKQIKG